MYVCMYIYTCECVLFCFSFFITIPSAFSFPPPIILHVVISRLLVCTLLFFSCSFLLLLFSPAFLFWLLLPHYPLYMCVYSSLVTTLIGCVVRRSRLFFLGVCDIYIFGHPFFFACITLPLQWAHFSPPPPPSPVHKLLTFFSFFPSTFLPSVLLLLVFSSSSFVTACVSD
jgi:hypothetical protein